MTVQRKREDKKKAIKKKKKKKRKRGLLYSGRKKETLASWGKGCNGEWKLSRKKERKRDLLIKLLQRLWERTRKWWPQLAV